jgi:hypothetical protein
VDLLKTSSQFTYVPVSESYSNRQVENRAKNLISILLLYLRFLASRLAKNLSDLNHPVIGKVQNPTSCRSQQWASSREGVAADPKDRLAGIGTRNAIVGPW